MVNPETGTLQSYQELWASPQDSNEAAMPDSAFPTTMTTTPRGNDWFKPQSYPHSSPLPSLNPPPKVRVVLALLHRPTSPVTKPQGLILRIGPYCQGIIEYPSSTIHDNLAVRSRRPEDGIVCVERWTLQPKNNTNHSSTSSSIPPLAQGMAAAAAAKNNNDQDKPAAPSLGPAAAAAVAADADENTSLGSVWVRDSRSDYEEDAQLGIWMPCVWCCEEAGTRTTMRRGLVVGDEMEKDGFVGLWRVAEVEG
jgi:Protein HRI1